MLGGYLTVTKRDTWHGSRIRYWQNRSKSLPSKNAESDVACDKRRFSSLRRRKQTFLLSEEKRLISQAKSHARKRQSGLSSLHEMRCFSIRPRSDLKMGFSASLLISKAKERIDWLCQYSLVIVKLDGWKNLIGRNFIFLTQVKNKTLSTVNAFPFSLVHAISPSKNDIRTTATFCLFSRTQG